MKNFNKQMLDFINNTPTSYNAVHNIKLLLLSSGYTELFEEDNWELLENGKYFVVRGDSSLIAFNLNDQKGFNIIASHTDSPSFRIKSNPEMFKNGYMMVNTINHGGMINYSWLDRPLSFAGRVIYLDKGIYKTKIINVNKDTLLIPSTAIHLDPNINTKLELNRQKDMLPIMGLEAKYNIMDYVESELVKSGETFDKICDCDLFVYNRDKGKIVGDEFIMSPRLDDLACVYPSLMGFINSDNIYSNNVFCAFNNEEIGSLSKEGADSSFLMDTLTRICNGTNKDLLTCLKNTFIISADNAHAQVPYDNAKNEPTNKVELNKGIAIKHHNNYTTDGLSSTIFKAVCDNANVPYQDFECKSDMKCGSTLGGISTSHVSTDSVDVGIAQLSMHSANETIGIKDSERAYKAFDEFYHSGIEKEKGMIKILKK